MTFSAQWPLLRAYDKDHVARIALPLGGIGTGTVSLGGRGNLIDWEIMNRPAKGFVPGAGPISARAEGAYPPSFLIWVLAEGEARTRLLEGPLGPEEYEGDWGSPAPNHGFPRFRDCAFGAAYPLGQVRLSDPDVPVEVRLEAFNPLIPGDADSSGIPVAVLRYVVHNPGEQPVDVAVCGSMPNFIGMDGSASSAPNGFGRSALTGASRNRNIHRQGAGVEGVFMVSDGVDPRAEQAGTMALVALTDGGGEVTHRTAWAQLAWNNGLRDFWEDFGADGRLDEREAGDTNVPMASLAIRKPIAAGDEVSFPFLICWHFPNRQGWMPPEEGGEAAACCGGNRVGNYYASQYRDAWHVAEETTSGLPDLEERTTTFVSALCQSDLPDVVKEAALFNVSTLRTQTCFRTEDGHLFGWEGCCDTHGCCPGSCTHVWNYEQALAYLFGELSMSMRDVEFGHATRGDGMMSFRAALPLTRAQEFGRAAADGQMGCLMKIYRDWQLSGDDEALKRLWPHVKQALAFCWIEGGWDADKDGVMEGCQHNTMDVEYYGPNPQMGIWYLGALRAVEEMARYLDDDGFADACRRLFTSGSRWIDAHLYNGEYYEHEVRPPEDPSEVAPALLVGMGAEDLGDPDFQLGEGCLVDQLVGQFMAHVCGLGYLVDRDHVHQTLRSILAYNRRTRLHDHFNYLRSFALGDEAALVMASYPHGRPEMPFPYYTEVMTGFEYTAAVGLLYEGMVGEGLQCIKDIRDRYDGRRRNPFDEAECGHHYARAMASWAALLALTGFSYSAVTSSMTFAAQDGTFFWSTGYAWGVCTIEPDEGAADVTLQVLHGCLDLARFELTGIGEASFVEGLSVEGGEQACFRVTSV